jgi:hypothetical protein
VPEYNLIQAPELLQRVRIALGLRQAHFLSTINEGLQAVVVVEDLTKRGTASESTRRLMVGGNLAGGGAGTVVAFYIGSSATSINPRIYRVVRYAIGRSPAASGTAILFGHRIVSPAGSVFDATFNKQYYHPVGSEATMLTHPTGLLVGGTNSESAGLVTVNQFVYTPDLYWMDVPEARLAPDQSFKVIIADVDPLLPTWTFAAEVIQEPLQGS